MGAGFSASASPNGIGNMSITAKELRDATARGEGPLAKAADDEPVFLLRGQDNLAADLVAIRSVQAGLLIPTCDVDGFDKKVAEARAIAELMATWRTRKNPD